MVPSAQCYKQVLGDYRNRMSKTKVPKLKPRKVKGRIEILKAIPYRGIMVYLRKINDDIFEYLIPHKGEIYADYLIMKPKKGKKKLTRGESNQATALILSGAVSSASLNGP